MKKIQGLLTIRDWCAAATIAALYSAFVVVGHLKMGQLSEAPTYDDVGYYADAASRLLKLYEDGFPGLLRKSIALPPHAPYSTFATMAGFAIFGMHPWAVAAVQSLWIFVILAALRVALVDQPLYVFLSAAAAVLAWPLLGLLLISARPDSVCALLTVAGCLYIVASPWVGADRKRLWIAGAFAGAALLAKPSLSPVTLALFASAALLASATDFIERRGEVDLRRRFLRTNLGFLLIAAALSAPYYIFGLPQTIAYIHLNMLGADAALWRLRIPLLDHACYYLWGAGGQATMGAFLPLTALLLALAGALQRKWLYANRFRAGAVAIWALLAYAAVSIPAHKNAWLGIIVSWTVLFFFIAALCGIFRAVARMRFAPFLRAALSVCLVVVAATIVEFPVYDPIWGHKGSEPLSVSARRSALIDDIAETMLSPPVRVPAVYFPSSSKFLNSDVLQFALNQRNVPSIVASDPKTSGDLAAHLAAIARATDVVLFEREDPDLYGWMPSAALLPAIKQKLLDHPDFELRKTFDTADGEHHVFLFQRPPAFSDFSAFHGFLSIEGRWPPRGDERGRWALGEAASLELKSPGQQQWAAISVRALSLIADQSVSFSIDGKSIGSCSLPQVNQFKDCMIEIPGAVLPARIDLTFSRPGPENPWDGRRRSVWFSAISIKRNP
ncbi:hypothetical protein Msil_0715 [Methylocella silvestris BL2]|uniref:Glycosyltransferase RgtA/B/C/D-like domain-containing protein n=1 Tax=Methylocella silvestris (strain DSM 15510 / CIP 108128 / LMG 27833 / NCIMB 13906 / BL2) TaxID=395965 RepID=B8EP98_METSB|nr:hypothetical protein [Methylocella silvestris]ACK49686.1 hypothetical protein Msil_0715 [Methylocella silvestris BL2]